MKKTVFERCEDELIDLLYDEKDIYPCVKKYIDIAFQEGIDAERKRKEEENKSHYRPSL